jgi:uncharacterized protein involved in exopolysaccharide biosynthesis
MERTYTVREMVEALHRRRWLALGVAVAVLLVSGAAIVAVPSEYRAESVMQIEPHTIPADFFPSSLTSFDERMRTLKHGLLARPVLERVLDETGLYPKWRSDPDEALEKLRRDIEVRLEGEVAGGPPALLFVVEVRGSDRRKVAKAADLIPRAYAEMTRQVLQTQAKNLRVTLTTQLGELSRRLTTEEEKLVAFKTEHAIDTPDANEANLREAAMLTTQIEAKQAAMADARRRQQALMTALPEAASEAGYAGVDAEEVLRRLEAMRAAYGPNHPDVRRLERHYQDVAGRSATELQRFRAERRDSEVERIEGEIRDHAAALARLQADLQVVQKRLQAAPSWGERYRVLARDYETLRAKYTSTLGRASDAQSAEALLAADAPSLFRVVQPAAEPSRPSGPNRANLLFMALAAALGAAALATAGAEYFDSSLRGTQDATAFGVPVLATIPRIGPRQGAGRR